VDAESIDELLRRAMEAATSRPRPEAVYRVQFHAGFTFRQAIEIAPYWRDLGITHVYASPFLKARPGSTHGYDIVDHRTINPEIGSTEDFQAWVAALHEHGLGQVLDIVPNHMGVAANDNHWWNDVLENGPGSRYAEYFDIAWHGSEREELRDRVLLPVLGDIYGEVLESGQLRLAFDAGTFRIEYHDRQFPLTPRSYALVLGHRLDALAERLGADSPELAEYQSILTAIGHLPDRNETEAARVAERQREKEVIKRRLVDLTGRSDVVRSFIDENIATFNGAPGEPATFDLLDQLLSQQCYRLAYWRVATDEINYRRFFDINDLAALSMERADVFADAHELVLALLAEGLADGVRVDHPDGLYDPAEYFERLQRRYVLSLARRVYDTSPERFGSEWKNLEAGLAERLETAIAASPRPLYVVAEKILGASELLSTEWATDGTTGYEFATTVNGLFVNPAAEGPLTRLYRDLIDEYERFGEVVYRGKRLVLTISLASELHMLARQLDRLARKGRRSRDFTQNALRFALREVIVSFPVYRSYISERAGVHDTDRQYVETAIRRANIRNPLIGRPLFDFIRSMLLLEYPDGSTDADRAEQRRFAGKFQQVTSAVMAKGLEDTAFYRYHRLISLNDVGSDPSRFGVSIEAAHRFHVERQARWPYALSPLSTHDTKRSEDIRARLNVLSEMPEEWGAAVRRWIAFNAGLRPIVDDAPAPDTNEEYLLYQTLIGGWPLEPYTEETHQDFVRRVQAYMTKALHEAKVHSSWVNPNAAYDAAVAEFVARVLDPGLARSFHDDFIPLQRRVSHFGLLNSLSQTLLKLTSPGVPDTYQGTELWDFSLVDPDNRRPVDYSCRRQLLQDVQKRIASGDLPGLVRELVQHMPDGRVKLYVTLQTLACRRRHPGLFTAGEYRPLDAAGESAAHVFAFGRRTASAAALVAVPRLIVRLGVPDGRLPLGSEVWRDTRLNVAGFDERPNWRNVFTGERLTFADGRPGVAELLGEFPVALLVSEP
jgi:(1->4)-alpha-D-glucan 1-alpha-D-glucosylmutase